MQKMKAIAFYREHGNTYDKYRERYGKNFSAFCRAATKKFDKTKEAKRFLAKKPKNGTTGLRTRQRSAA